MLTSSQLCWKASSFCHRIWNGSQVQGRFRICPGGEEVCVRMGVLLADNNDKLGFILITKMCPFFHKRNSQAFLLNKEITHTLIHGSTQYNILYTLHSHFDCLNQMLLQT